MSAAIKYVAQISSVREVALLGTADLAFWREHLRKEALYPFQCDGKAQLLIGATDARFKGIRFQELIIAVYVSQQEDGAMNEGVFLAHAYNSSRLFAFFERNWFSTPYYHGKIAVDVGRPVSFEVAKDDALLRVEMASDLSGPAREPLRDVEEGWYGPVYLPSNGSDLKKDGKAFIAKIGGQTQAYPFHLSEDRITIKSTPKHPALGWLLESGFTGKEWNVRACADHAKSKTYRRSELGGLEVAKP